MSLITQKIKSELIIGGKLIDKHNSDWMEIYNNISMLD